MQPFDIERLVQSYLCSSELELALEAFDEFEKRGLVPVTSVFTRLMATLMDYDEYSLAFSYMKRHVERSQVTVPKRLWGRLLSCCARDFLVRGTLLLDILSVLFANEDLTVQRSSMDMG